MSLLLALSLFILQPAPAPAALVIRGPANIAQHTLGQYSVTGGTGTKVAWMVVPQTSHVVSNYQLIFTSAPGSYTVIAFAIENGEPTIIQQAVQVTGPAPSPAPAPTPDPTPEPAPAPVPNPSTTGPYWVAFVTDASSKAPLTIGQMLLRNSTTIAGRLKALAFGNQWAPNVDINSPVLVHWAAAARRVGLPCVLILGKDAAGVGVFIEGIPKPFDDDTVVEEIRRLAGGGAPR